MNKLSAVGFVRKLALWLYSFLDLLPVALPVAIAAFGVVAMLFLLSGNLQTWPVMILGLLAAAVSVYVLVKYRKADNSGIKERNICNLLVFIGVVVWGAFNFLYSSQHIITNRDPGTYTNAGIWLVHHNNLVINNPSITGNLPGFSAESGGFSNFIVHGQTHIYAQGAHLLPIFLGLTGRLAGIKNLFHMNILFGITALLAFYAFARLLARPRWAAIVTGALAASMPFIYFSRDTYTEPLAATFTFGALALLWYAQKNKHLVLWFLAGLVAGAGTLTRIDGYLTIAALCIFAAVWVALAKGREFKERLIQSLALGVGMAITGILGWLDLVRLSPQYYDSLHGQFRQESWLLLGIIILGTLGIILARRTRILGFINKKSASWRSSAAAAAVIIIAVVLISRPLWFKGFGPIHPAGIIGTDVLAEYTTEWLLWYMGPLLALFGLIGFAMVAYHALRRRDLLLAGGLAVIGLTSLIYLISPSISLDQIWASRRIVPVIMPGIAAFSVVSLEWLYQEYKERFRFVKLYAVLAMAALVIGPAITSKPLLFDHDTNLLAPMQTLCNKLPAKSAVIWVGTARTYLVQPTRGLCGIDSIGYGNLFGSPASPNRQILSEAAKNVYSRGLTPLIGLYSNESNLVPITERTQLTPIVNSYRYQVLQNTVTTAPQGTDTYDMTLMIGKLQPNGAITRIGSNG